MSIMNTISVRILVVKNILIPKKTVFRLKIKQLETTNVASLVLVLSLTYVLKRWTIIIVFAVNLQ